MLLRLAALLLAALLPALAAAQEPAAAPSSPWSGGTLAIPFKIHLDGAITPGGTVGAYIGYRFDALNAVALTPVASAGVSAISGTSTAGPGKSFSTLGATAAGGIVGQFLTGSKLHFGLLVGMDWTGHGIQYQYSGKPYLSVSIGYPLTQ